MPVLVLVPVEEEPDLLEVAAPPLTQFILLDVVLLSVGLFKGEQLFTPPGDVCIVVPGVLVVVAPVCAKAMWVSENSTIVNIICLTTSMIPPCIKPSRISPILTSNHF